MTHSYQHRLTIIFALIMCTLLQKSQALASSVELAGIDRLSQNGYSYRAQNTPLNEVLNAFSAHYGLSAVTSECLVESYNGHLKAASAESFLSKLSSAYNFIWFKVGSTIYFNCPSEIQTKLITLNISSAQVFITQMAQVGLELNKFGMRTIPNTGMILLSGPPQFLEIAINAAKGIDDLDAKAPTPRMMPYVVPLFHTRAGDKKLDNGEVDQGLVTKLRELLGYSKDNAKGNIVADSSANSILIYDTESTVQSILPIIQTLDQTKRQIEISVSIIDITESALKDIGLTTWQLQGNEGNIKVDPLDGIIEGLLRSGTTLSNNRVNLLQFKLKALEQENKARTLSKPTLLTKENTRAVISKKEEFYAKVEAKEDAQLVPLHAGTELIVIPTVVPSENDWAISLDITLKDGSRETETISDLPVIKTSTIITQATVKKGESLLIGGFYNHIDTSVVSKVPLLGDIPLLGRLFRYDSDDSSRNVRLFLIKPRILGELNQENVLLSNTEQTTVSVLPEVKAWRAALQMGDRY